MKTLTRLLTCAAVAAVSVAQVASAGVLFTNIVENIKGMGVRVNPLGGANPIYSQTYPRAYTRNNSSGDVGKAWIQFDLSGSWDLYGKSNLVAANLWLWCYNGTTCQFWVASLADEAGLEGWDMWDLWWTNAPGNDVNSGYKFDYTKCYGGTNIWERWSTNPPGIDVSIPGHPDYNQSAIYISPDIRNVLAADTDGKVTFMISGSPVNNNQNWWVGIAGTWTNEPIHPGTGLPVRASPRLVLVFDVRVALAGGGVICPGGQGKEIYMTGTDVGCDYLLYRDGEYTGQTISGTGSAVSFGTYNVPGVYMCVESNVTTGVTRTVPGTAVISYAPPPTVPVQPQSVTAATNSVAVFSLSAQ